MKMKCRYRITDYKAADEFYKKYREIVSRVFTYAEYDPYGNFLRETWWIELEE